MSSITVSLTCAVNFSLALARLVPEVSFMEIEFADDLVALIETDEAGQTRFSIAIIKSARRKLAVMRAAEDERTLRNWKSLHYEKLKGDREGQRSVRLNDQYRLIFLLDADTSPPKIIVLGIEDYH